ncbi:LysR family transcriptional regulator [Buttiauxella sp. A111]|uniref:LysR family transcriptional regulator n=1 Tax=Buttiauxella sp. A111 TaxID=2563088 RepID=UPI0010D3302C|nr:LysR family transcriptional regulator [Buttiauxella sp. A111]GDX06623.1 LysR family transcriptional regulator [Buttiauxella sp. A111]
MTILSTDKFDFNLIRFLVAIVETTSMANAAEILDVAPSAVSYAVKKLREHYNDPLFIRSLHGVKPTALALNLYERFRIINDDILNTLSINSTSIHAKRKIYIRADNLTELWITNRLISHGIVPAECNIEFRYAVISAEERSQRIRTQEIDLDIGLTIPGDRNIVSYHLFDWEYILICRDNHSSIGETITSKQFSSEPYIGYYFRFNSTIIHNNFSQLRMIRPLDPSIASESTTTMVLNILSQDLLMFIPRIYFTLLSETLPIREVKCDFIPEGKVANLVHLNKKNASDPLLKKIISVLKQA